MVADITNAIRKRYQGLPRRKRTQSGPCCGKQYNEQINAILTPEQQAKWKAAKKEIFAKQPSPTADSQEALNRHHYVVIVNSR